MPTNEDGVMNFVQNSNLYYLSGIDQEETKLIVAPDYADEEMREILFVKATNEHIAIWEGHKFTKEEATAISGIKKVLWSHEFESTLDNILATVNNIYLDKNEHLRASGSVETQNDRLIKDITSNYPLHQKLRAAPLVYDLRSVKSAEEIAFIQKAIDITESGFKRVLKFLRPGKMEFEVEAELIHEFTRLGSTGFAFQPIVASGKSGCVLHYIENSKEIKDGDLVLMDIGAKYGGYNADLTRSVPANGRFSKRQAEVYKAVLHVQREAKKLLTPGNSIRAYHKQVGEIMTEQLVKIGLLKQDEVNRQDPKKPLYRKYFMHGTSHHLGLGVHDVGSPFKKFEAGMVFTVEPGIYILEEGIGIRLEDDVVIQENGEPKNLMKNVPIEIEEIEDLMNS